MAPKPGAEEVPNGVDEAERPVASVELTGDIPPRRTMPKWHLEDDVVISGLAGRFPEADNFDEYADNLYKNLNMVTIDNRRWPIELNDGHGSAAGKLKEIDKFDSSFFSTMVMLADAMDPQARILLETTYEAIADAGIFPHSLRGSRTGVYVGINTVACAEGIPQDDFQDARRKEAALWVQGSSKALYANRISFIFDFIGPSTLIDTACSSSMVAFENAVQDLRCGACDYAVVATANLCPAPFSNHIYSSIGVLSSDGKCKVFDKKADGFVRSETIGCVFLQRKSDAKRIYANVIHAKTNTDGAKTIGIFAPFWLRQRNLMIETYQEAGINPHDIKFFESHGTGTNVGDPQEAKAIAEAYCSGGRKDPLLIGAVKSNCGHSEGSSGLNSLAKVLCIFENQCIPANINYQEPRAEIEVIINKTLIPVIQNTPFKEDIIGLNSFGIGGVNAHALLRANKKEIDPDGYKLASTIPRLVNVCGRTLAAVDNIFDFIEKNPSKVTRDFLALLGEVMKTKPLRGSSGFPFRGYMLLTDKGEREDGTIQYEYKRTIVPAQRNEAIWLVFSGMGSQWPSMAKSLMTIPTFAKSISRAANCLKPYNIDLYDLLLSPEPNLLKKNTINPFVAITSMQVALYDLIRELNIPIEGIVGHSFGEVACAYADGCLTLEQTILTAYWRGKIVETSRLPKGMLAAVGLTWEEAQKKCPDGIVAACHNGSDSVTISGLYEPMLKFVEELKKENIFVRPVAGGDFPYHSPFMKAVEAKLLEALNTVIKSPKPRSSKWLSTSWHEDLWECEDAKYASAKYFVNNLVSPVLFNEAMKKVAKNNSTVVEVAPHALFESIFKRCFSGLNYVGLMKRAETDNLDYFLQSVGRIYTLGANPDIENFYPKVQWPVARGTQSISSLIKWDHDRSYVVKKYPEFHSFATASDFVMKFSFSDFDWMFLKDHCVDGRCLFPATGYIMLVWRRIAAIKGQPWMKTPVAFENVRFHRPTLLSEGSEVKFVIRILEGTGEFTISEGNQICSTGRVYIPDENQILELQDRLEDEEDNQDDVPEEEQMNETLENKDIYKELRIRGYDYGPKFQGLVEARGDGRVGKCRWTGHFISFFDSMMHLALVAFPIRALFVPVGFQSIRVDPNLLFGTIKEIQKQQAEQARLEEEARKAQEEAEAREEKEREAKRKAIDELTERDQFKASHFLEDIKPDLEKEEASNIMKEQVQSTIKVGEEGMAAELLGTGVNFDEDEEEKNNKQPVILPVKFDYDLRAVITKGLEAKGLIPVNIPRRSATQGLQLETYEFVPHTEERAIDDRVEQDIVEYVQVCSTLLNKFLTAAGKDAGRLQLSGGYRLAKEETVKKYLEMSVPDERHVLLRLCQELLKLTVDENGNVIETNPKELSKSIQELTSRKEFDLSDDLITTAATNERFLRSTLDMILENGRDKQLKMFEVSSKGSIATHVVHLLKSVQIGSIDVDCAIASPSPADLPDSVKTAGYRTIEWDTSTHQFLKDSGNLDLLFYRPSAQLIETWNVDEQVELLTNALKQKGFLILSYRTKITPPELALKELTPVNCLNPKLVNDFIAAAATHNLQLIGTKSDSLTHSMAVFRKVKSLFYIKPPVVINVADEKLEDWVEKVKDALNDYKMDNNPDNTSNIWLTANDTPNGIIGMTNCLRLEPGGHGIRCIYDVNRRLPQVNFDQSPYKELLQLDLTTNIYKDGKWGTYRLFRMPEQQETILSEHAYLNVITRGDMSSLRWFEAPHKFYPTLSEQERNPQEVLCHVYYSALNFKDVVLVSGKIAPGPESALFDCIIGLEFAGRRSDTGARVMGMVPFRGIATTLMTYKDYLWEIPDSWTLEDAATVPVVYTTAYYALVTRGNLQEGESVLIHSGAGGVGQAAIMICQSYNCDVYVTVGNPEKEEFIMRKFGIPKDHIANSHDVTFERQIMKVTKGRGVDVVLNSLTEDKLQASVRCLAANGRFLEIGKYDMQMNKNLGLFAFLNNISFHGVGLDVIFREGPKSKILQNFMRDMSKLMKEGIEKGVVKPIERTVFEKPQAEDAFRYMTLGKHIGKVLIKIREEEPGPVVVKNPTRLLTPAITRTWFHASKVYIILGGLGGFGLEFAYWLVLRGAKKIILTSRIGIKNDYQQLYLKRFTQFGKFVEDYKIDISVSTNNAIEMEGAEALINEALEKGPVGGIFNLALVLNDGLMENQSVQTFKDVCDPKTQASINLDILTRKKCPQLDYFVAFSSLTSGRGNSGQANYGYGNSLMERLCEQRRKDGLPGLAIQWGPIGDVGIVAEQLLDSASDKADILKLFGGIMLQRLNSCLDVLDRFLQVPKPVLSSLVKADLESSKTSTEDEVLNQLCNHLNIDKRPNNETLGDVGLDSMMAVEIQQRLERDYEITMSLADIKKITVGELKEFRDGNRDSIKMYASDIKRARMNLAQIRFDIPSEPISYLNEVREGKPVFFLPPVEGIFKTLEELASKINRPVIALNWMRTMQGYKDIKRVSQYYKDKLKHIAPEGRYDLVGHSFGGVVAIHMMRKLAPVANLVIMDPSQAGLKDYQEEDERMDMLFTYLKVYIPERVLNQVKREVMECPTEQSRVSKLIELMKHYGGKHLQGKDVDEIIRASFERADMMIRYKKKNAAKAQAYREQTQAVIKKKIKKINATATVIKLLKKPEDLQVMEEKILETYGLKKEDFEGAWAVETIIGNEAEFLSPEKGNLQRVLGIINSKLV